MNFKVIYLLSILAMYTCLFDGITYSPYDTSGCLNQQKITSQLINISNYTTNIKIYSADCNQIPTITDIIAKYHLNLKVYLGIWVRSGQARMQTDLNSVIQAIKAYPNLILGVAVGNEEIFNGMDEIQLINFIQTIRSQLKQQNINIPITTNEVYKSWSKNLLNNCDIFMPTVYAYYSPPQRDGSATSAAECAMKEIEDKIQSINSNKPMIIGETGFPSSGSAPTQFTDASIQNQCQYLARFKCLANKKGYKYYFMEAYDAGWKSGYSSEHYFGVFNDNNRLKCNTSAYDFQC